MYCERTDTRSNGKFGKCIQIIAHFEVATVYCLTSILQGYVLHR